MKQLKTKPRRRPIFPAKASIFGAGRFNFSVRNGKRWVPTAIITEILPLTKVKQNPKYEISIYSICNLSDYI